MKKSFVLIVIGIALYSFSLFNGFVWDDEVYIQQNPALSQDANSLMTQAYFRPVITAVYSTFYTVFGPHPFFYHLFQVIFHIATVLLLFYLFKRFFREHIAFFLSLLFLVHPANVEAVCFASAMQEVLFTFTGILGLYLFVTPAEAGVQPINFNSKKDNYPLDSRVRGNDISTVTIFLSTILFIIALLMKETGIVFFALAFCYLFLFHRKNKSTVLLYISFVIIVLFTYGMARLGSGNMYLQGQSQGLFPIMRVSFATRLINIPMIILYYVWKFIFPLNLGIAQHWVVHTVTLQDFWLPLSVVGGLFSLGIYVSLRLRFRVIPAKAGEVLACGEIQPLIVNSKKEDYRLDARLRGHDKQEYGTVFTFFFLWFLIGLLPHLQIVPLNMTVAERWMYFPMIGLVGMIGAIMCHPEPAVGEVKDLARETSETRHFVPRFFTTFRMTMLGIMIISILFLRSFIRTLDWRTGLALYSSSITQESSFDLQNNMGVELFRTGKYTQAKTYFEKSTRLAPYWWVNWNNLGASYEREQNFAKAREYYEKSVKNGYYALAYENLAKLLVQHEKDIKIVEAFLKKSIDLFPENTTLRGIQAYYYTNR